MSKTQLILCFSLFLFCILGFYSWLQNNKNSFIIYYTVSEFETDMEDSRLMRGLNAKNSNFYKLDFKNSKDFSNTELATSGKEIVYYDFCQSKNGEIYAMGGKFHHSSISAIIDSIIPSQGTLHQFDEIRARDCSFFMYNKKEYMGVITHGSGTLNVFDTQTSQVIASGSITYSESLKDKIYNDITMTHEIIHTDLDDDGYDELYMTPSTKNVPIGKGQNGLITQGKFRNNSLEIQVFDSLGENIHAKEVHPIIYNGKKSLLVLATTSIDYLPFQNNKPAELSGKALFAQGIKAQNEAFTQLYLYQYTDGEVTKNEIGKNNTYQCRVVSQGNFGFSDEDIAIGCNEKGISIYTQENNTYILKKNIYFKTPVIALDSIDTNNDGVDELFFGVNGNGLYHHDLRSDSTTQLIDLSGADNWIWSLEVAR